MSDFDVLLSAWKGYRGVLTEGSPASLIVI